MLQPACRWSETDSTIRITIDNVPIKDASQLFCGDRLVKVNAPPYLLLLDLRHAVDEDRSSASIVRGRKLVIKLAKAVPGLWGKLTADGDAATIKREREASVQRAHDKLAAAAQARVSRKQQAERAALDLQLAQDKTQRGRVEALKQAELQQERGELAAWQAQLHDGDSSDYEDDEDTGLPTADAAADDGSGGSCGGPDAAAGGAAAALNNPAYHGKGWWPGKVAAGASSDSTVDAGSSSSSSSSQEDDSLVTIVPAASGSSSSCADRLAADLAACSSSAAAATHGAAVALDASEEEGAQPMLTAISSTRRPLQAAAQPAHASRQQQQQRSAQSPAPVRCRQAAPVAVTFTQLETPHLPAREAREVEIKQVRRAAAAAAGGAAGGPEGDSLGLSDRQPAFLKDKGDALATQGNYRGAVNAYSRALELDPQQAALWANRAAAHLALGQAAECVQDCSTAISLVQGLRARLVQGGASPGQHERELQAGMLAKPLILGQPASAGAAASGAADDAGAGEAAGAADAADASPAAVGGEEALLAIASTCGSPQATTAGAAAGSEAGLTEQLRVQLVKLLARRAAAHVELQQLQEAQQDLEQGLSLDPGNQMLQADALEVAAALRPDSSADDAEAVQARADARFRAGDMQGASDAYTAVLTLLQQPQQQQVPEDSADEREAAGQQERPSSSSRQLLVAARSNRAACWLALGSHERCVTDCSAGLATILSPAGAAGAGDGSGQAGCGATSVLQQHPPALLLQDGSLTGPQLARSAARLAARLAAAHTCLKQAAQADAAYAWAAACWAALGEPARAAAIDADRRRVLAASEQHPEQLSC